MFRLSSLLVLSCALLSTFALPSICSPSSSSTSFVVAAPSNALFRDSTRLTNQLNRVLLEINSVLDSEYHNEDDKEQEELEDEQEIEQSASDDPLEDLLEGDQIIGTINEAAAGAVKIEEIPEKDETEKDETNPRSKKSGGLVRFGKGTRNFMFSPIKTSRQWYDRVKQYRSPDAKHLRRENKLDRIKSQETKRRGKYDINLKNYVALRLSPDTDELQRSRFGRWYIGTADKIVGKAHVVETKRRALFDIDHAASRERLAASRERLAKKAGSSKVNPTPPEPES